MQLDEAGLEDFGARLARVLRAGDVVMLSGELGAGKTSLARSVLRGLGHAGDVPSPTFTLAQVYDHLPLPVMHCDLYRLEDATEAEVLGLDDWLEQGALLIEWPERLEGAIWPERLWLRIEGAGGPSRTLVADCKGDWDKRWLHI